MRKVKVVSKKYDGSPRDECESYLYKETDETIVLFTPPELTNQDGLIEIYFKQKWFNVWHICEQFSNTNRIYINIAMPVRRNNEGLEWIDLELDYRVHVDNSVEKLDQEEFEVNSHLMKYPQKLIRRVQSACREVETGLINRFYPFDHEQQVALYNRIKNELFAG